ncbi:DUF7033 domain-containing protein [Hymenobacter jejuensis]|uniref:DUF7033 domain-containing protein n=1 Tax=Hymenobacter jejuensis TaxID=2502781 RepID=A0A5B7ZUV6_9BACT|nr:hypothetical protein [Hymenobacter jejuensis]QDA58617.1 hypothetical protein FHG12_00215 [Hymenobacter jejuensis]
MASAQSVTPSRLASAAASTQARLAYILLHFRVAYPGAAEVSIGYEGTGSQVEITAGAGAFFSQTSSYPPAPTWREWHGRRVPFFFDVAPAAELLKFSSERVVIQADIISGAFYLLSGWQEYFSEARDQHGRFPFQASVQQRYGFVTLPVVNYYFDVLKTAVEHITGRKLQSRRWTDEAPFATFVTHDIDNLHSAWKAPAKAALRRRNWLAFGRQLWLRFTHPDAWDNLEHVQTAVAEHNAKSTFFLLPQHQPAPNGTPNADYRLQSIWRRMQSLQAKGAELALHGSIGTATNIDRLRGEASKINTSESDTCGLRFHYLSWEPRITPQLVDQLHFAFDSTLGFAEHFGFRHSYCLPFYPFDFEHGRAHNFLEIPLNVMDATLHHPKYLQLQPTEILPALTPMLQEIERFGGIFTLLWHNENFDPANELTGPRQFHAIMKYLRSRNTAFLTGSEILAAQNRRATGDSH